LVPSRQVSVVAVLEKLILLARSPPPLCRVRPQKCRHGHRAGPSGCGVTFRALVFVPRREPLSVSRWWSPGGVPWSCAQGRPLGWDRKLGVHQRWLWCQAPTMDADLFTRERGKKYDTLLMREMHSPRWLILAGAAGAKTGPMVCG
jgi:hypothetical protein